jgi:ATP-binding cassette, subfamily C (CFTR/MRP), member 1
VFESLLSLKKSDARLQGMAGSQSYLQFWTRLSPEELQAQFGPRLGGYIAIFGGYVIFFGISVYLQLGYIASQAGTGLHKSLLEGILFAPLSFFDSRASGQVLGRFSQDLFSVDQEWLMWFANVAINGLEVLASVVLMSIEAPYLLIAVFILCFVIYLLRSLYIPSSRQLRRLEMAAKSPIYTLIGDTTQGLSVIRAFGREDQLRAVNSAALNVAQRPFYFAYAVRRWLQVWLDVCTMILNTCLAIIVVAMRHSPSAGLLGAALSRKLGTIIFSPTQSTSVSSTETIAISLTLNATIVSVYAISRF